MGSTDAGGGRAARLATAAAAAAGVAGAGMVARLGWQAYQTIGTPPARVGFRLSPDELARARELLARHPAIDTHAHPGRTFVAAPRG